MGTAPGPRWGTHLVAFVAGVGLGAATILVGRDDEPRATPAAGAATSASAPSRSDAPPARAAREDLAPRVAELTRQVEEARAACAATVKERDDAVARIRPSLLDAIAAIDEEGGLKAERRVREMLQGVRSEQVHGRWAQVVGPDVPEIQRPADNPAVSHAQARFRTLYSELRSPRTQQDVRRLYDAFVAAFGPRLDELFRREDAQRRGKRGDEALAATREVRAELWRAGEEVLAALGPLVTDEERAELRLGGSRALGIPEPVERLRLGWDRLVGDDLAPADRDAITIHEPFVWVYVCLERERSREELRAMRTRLVAAHEAEVALGEAAHWPRVYDAVKADLTPHEWLRLRYFPEGRLDLSR